MNKKDLANYNYRKDVRDDKTFKKQIKERTKRENILMEIYAQKMNVEFEHNGMDNSGKVIKESSKVNKNPDFIIKDHFIDVKISPSHNVTLKLDDLNYLEKFPNKLSYLIFLQTNMRNENDEPSPNTQFFFLKKNQIELFKSLSQFIPNDQWFGFKSTYRSNKSKLENHFKIKNLYD